MSPRTCLLLSAALLRIFAPCLYQLLLISIRTSGYWQLLSYSRKHECFRITFQQSVKSQHLLHRSWLPSVPTSVTIVPPSFVPFLDRFACLTLFESPMPFPPM